MSALDRTVPVQAQQAAAVPFRYRNKRLEFCLVTSTSGRWIFPKGVISGQNDYVETALSEAYEEAGLHGRILQTPLGSYDIRKQGEILTVVAVLMEVTKTDARWKEDSWRERLWVTAKVANELLKSEIHQELLEFAIERINDG